MGTATQPAQPATAHSLYQSLASKGSGRAASRIAVLAAMGAGRPQNWDEALDQLEQAAALHERGAQRQLLLLSGRREAGGSSPAAWRRLRGEVDLAAWLAPPQPQPLSAAPNIFALPGFASRAVCRWIVAAGEPRLEEGWVNDVVTGQRRADPMRTATATAYTLLTTDLIMVMLQERLARAASLPLHHHEPPNLLSYKVGQEYQPHFDFINPGAPTFADELKIFGQRVATCLTYLNDEYEGGETHFPEIDLKYRGGLGDALVFFNVDKAGQPDPKTLHAGTPPTRGRKLLLSQWVRDRVQPIL